MKMPILQPLPISTSDHSFIARMWVLFSCRRKWQVNEDWFYTLPNNRKIMIPKGFIFDGSSYPAILWLLFSPTGFLLIPTLIHDFCFKHDYLLGVRKTGEKYKFQANKGFFYWNNLARQIGTTRNNLSAIDYFVWLVALVFGGLNWRAYRSERAQAIEK